MKNIEEFYNEIMASEELKDKLAEASANQKLDEFLKENGIDCTKEQLREYALAKAAESGELSAEEFEAFVKEKECGSRELSDEELGAVAGGYDWGRRIDYRNESSINDSSYDFNVGDYVYAYDGWFFGYCTKKVEILSRTTKKVRLKDFEKMQKSDFYRPAYLVKYDDGETDIIEQQMLAKM